MPKVIPNIEALQVPAVQQQPHRLFIHMFTYYHKYPTGHSAQRDYSGLNLSWHRNEQESQWMRWLKLASLNGTCNTNKATDCMPLGSIMNWWHHPSLTTWLSRLVEKSYDLDKARTCLRLVPCILVILYRFKIQTMLTTVQGALAIFPLNIRLLEQHVGKFTPFLPFQ